MKRFIAAALCLIMCVSVISANALTAFAANTTTFFDVKSSGVKNSEISFVINLKPNVTRFNGAVLNVEFDETVLEIKSATPVYTKDEEGNDKLNVYGEYIHGFVNGSNNTYAVAYMNNNGVTTGNSEYKSLFKVTFKIITAERPKTSVKFYCKEYSSDDDVNNEIRPSDERVLIKEEAFSTLDTPTPLSTSLLETGILFKWEAVAGAEEYTIIKKADNTGVWEEVAQVSSDYTSYLDRDVESGVKYTYSVTCGNGYGDSGYIAAGVTQLFLQSPKITVIANTVNAVRVTWSSVGGAESYAIYRADSSALNKWVLLNKTASERNYYVDEAVVSNNTYKYSIVAENGADSSTIGANSVSHLYLAAPEFLSVENTVNGIELNWSFVSGATEYELYRRTDITKDWQLLTKTAQLSYVDKDVTAGTTYFYTLKAVNSSTTSSYNTSESIAFLASPKVSSQEALADGIMVKWQPSQGATAYTVYRMHTDKAGAEWEEAGTVNASLNYFKDTGAEGGNYKYGVAATIGDSQSPMGVAASTVYLIKAPKNVSIQNVMDGMKLTWEPVSNAAFYIVERIENETGEVKRIADVYNKTTYTDKSVKDFSKYSYLVNSVDNVKGWKSLRTTFSNDFYRVPPPTVQSVTPETKAIVVKWSALSGVDSYNVYRKTDGDWIKIASVEKTESSYMDEDIKSGVNYTYTVTAVKGNTESYIGDENSKGASYVNMPSALSASLTANGISLSWEITDELSDFVIYKRVKGQTEWKHLKKTSSSVTTYIDTDVSSGVTYEYAIKAVSLDGTFESPLSEVKEVTFLSVVKNIKLAIATNGVKLTWSKVAGAENYIIYRRLKNGSWVTVDTVSSATASYVDEKAESGKTYLYTVRALANGCRSSYENAEIYFIAAPQITKFDSQIGKGITIKWADVHGAQQYIVYRKTGSSGWKRIGTTTNLLFLDKNVKLGTTYVYTLKAVTASGITSNYYTSGWKRQFTPGTPTGTTVLNSANAIKVSWKSVNGASGYIVYRKANNSTSWTRIATVKSTSYMDKSVKANVKYTYTIKAYKGKVYSQYNTTGWSGAILSAPTVKIANSSTGVKVTWTKNSAASGYAVYRSTYDPVNKSWSAWSSRGTAAASKTSWVDTSAQSGKTYRYTVRTVCGSCKSAYKASNSVTYLKEPKVTISNATTGVTVKWTQALQAKGYKVYRAELNEATGVWSSWKYMGQAKSTVNSWTDRSVISGVTYKYTVRSANGSALSSYTASAELTYLTTPQLMSAFKTAEGNAVTYQQVAGAEGYRIYRKTDSDNTWVTVDTVKGNDYTTYVDKDIIENEEYTYTVRAFSGKYFSAYNKNGVACK